MTCVASPCVCDWHAVNDGACGDAGCDHGCVCDDRDDDGGRCDVYDGYGDENGVPHDHAVYDDDNDDDDVVEQGGDD